MHFYYLDYIFGLLCLAWMELIFFIAARMVLCFVDSTPVFQELLNSVGKVPMSSHSATLP